MQGTEAAKTQVRAIAVAVIDVQVENTLHVKGCKNQPMKRWVNLWYFWVVGETAYLLTEVGHSKQRPWSKKEPFYITAGCPSIHCLSFITYTWVEHNLQWMKKMNCCPTTGSHNRHENTLSKVLYKYIWVSLKLSLCESCDIISTKESMPAIANGWTHGHQKKATNTPDLLP